MCYRFQRSTVTSGDFRDCFVQYIAANGTNAQITSVGTLDWDKLFHSPGMPSHAHPDFSTSLSECANVLAKRWIDASDEGVSAAGFNTQDIKVFNSALCAATAIDYMWSI